MSGSLSVNTNITSLHTHNVMTSTNKRLTDSLGRLSSGLRVNSAKDDAAGLAIAEKMKAQVEGLHRASQNAQDSINFFQTAEGGMVEQQGMLHRMRELAVQAANGVLTANDRLEIQKEVEQLKEEIDRISKTTEFNTKKLLDGSSAGLWSTDAPDKISAIVNGNIAEGNYKLTITATPGQNQVWKSDIMTLTEDTARTLTAAEVTKSVSNNSSNSVSDILTTTNITVSSSVTSSVSYNYTFQEGLAAEIAGTDIGAVTVSRTNATMALGTAASAQTVYFSAEATFSVVSTGGTASKIQIQAGTYTKAELGQLLALTANGGSLTVTWTANAGAAGGEFIELNNATGNDVTLSVNAAAAAALGLSDGATISNASQVKGTENTEEGMVYTITGNAGEITGVASATFDINGTTVTIDMDKTTGGSARTALRDTLTTVSYSEQELLDLINNTMDTGNTGVRAQIGIDHELTLVTSTADGTSRPSSIQVSSLSYNFLNSGSTFSLGDIGISAATESNQGNDTIVFSVNTLTGVGTLYTAQIAAGTYADTEAGRNSLSAAIQTAMNNAIQAGGGSSDDYVDVFNDGGAAAGGIHITTRTVGDDAAINLFDGAGLTSALNSLGLELNKHAQGNDDGVSLQITNSAGTQVSHIYNRRGAADAAANWDAAGVGTEVSHDRNLDGLALNFSNSALQAGDTGSFSIDITQAGEKDYIAQGNDTLASVRRFYDADNNFILERANTLWLYGNGNKTSIQIGKEDTLDDLQQKIQEAITGKFYTGNGTYELIDKGLAMRVDVSGSNTEANRVAVERHVTDYVGNNTAHGTSETTAKTATGETSVEGTFVIRSPWVGSDGVIEFGGDEELLKALSLVEIQKVDEYDNDSVDDGTDLTKWNVEVRDAHTNEYVGADEISNSRLKDVIDGAEVIIQPTADIAVGYNSSTQAFDFASKGGETVYLHLVDTSTTSHIGANKNQTMDGYISQSDTKSLGVNKVVVTSQKAAESAIKVVDDAINTISSERARLGAYVNRLEHTMNNLSVQSENMNASRASITDLDMASEMIEMTRNQVLSQSSNAMMAQANQLPQNVLQLLR